ncbi:hypothetical protein CLOACE_00460 [Clostridium acetireducens DSM 10703]|jgi:DNA-binding transcriptional regulator of glucitol operon|uniref:DUF4044 domain-containing protein n=1 Tax=Clostridium acetireducens DSM 10703 TaxID=1121290 RepID=A0A1E8F2W5_9CLOT|nr:DUF4044 domain-containing protein [Clostridium acetireducens]OFI07698.1 hypothetical protein CLOACE_00460 [Clostridium acetireducens DSM 10703]
MKKKTRDKMMKILIIFLVIMFIAGLLPMIFI